VDQVGAVNSVRTPVCPPFIKKLEQDVIEKLSVKKPTFQGEIAVEPVF
jgi:hypothetical protein